MFNFINDITDGREDRERNWHWGEITRNNYRLQNAASRE